MSLGVHVGRGRLVGTGLFLVAIQACGGNGGGPPDGSSGGASGPGTGGDSPVGGSPGVGGSIHATGGQSSSGGSGSGGDTSLGGAESGGAPGAGGSNQVSSAPSCAGMTGSECQGGDCCESLLVPGGTIQVDGADYELPDFYLDQFEVTVARFRQFQVVAEAWQEEGHPAEGDGAHPDVPESGWRTSWLLEFEDVFADELFPTWRDYPDSYTGTDQDIFISGVPTYQVSGADDLAVNHVPFHIAFAFCIWDGGRLPARAEWLYAATGGDEPTDYVWGDTPAPEEMFATIPEADVQNPHPTNESWDFLGILPGSHPASAGRFGHQDLASGLGEYLRDTGPPEGEELGGLIELGNDEEISGLSFSYLRPIIGTSWQSPGALDEAAAPTPGSAMLGFRCARDP